MNEVKRDILLTSTDLTMILDALNDCHIRTIRKYQRMKQVRTQEQVQELAKQQILIQYIARTRYEWINFV